MTAWSPKPEFVGSKIRLPPTFGRQLQPPLTGGFDPLRTLDRGLFFVSPAPSRVGSTWAPETCQVVIRPIPARSLVRDLYTDLRSRSEMRRTAPRGTERHALQRFQLPIANAFRAIIFWLPHLLGCRCRDLAEHIGHHLQHWRIGGNVPLGQHVDWLFIGHRCPISSVVDQHFGGQIERRHRVGGQRRSAYLWVAEDHQLNLSDILADVFLRCRQSRRW